jgi:hypothetical protein
MEKTTNLKKKLNLNFKGVWVSDKEKNNLISYLEGNNQEQLINLLHEIYNRDKSGFLK